MRIPQARAKSCEDSESLLQCVEVIEMLLSLLAGSAIFSAAGDVGEVSLMIGAFGEGLGVFRGGNVKRVLIDSNFNFGCISA